MSQKQPYRLMFGIHLETDPAAPKPKAGETPQDRVFRPGDIVESEVDMVKEYGQKFSRIDQGGMPFQRPRVVDLEGMTVPQLIDFAGAEEIDLKDAPDRAAMLKTIRTALGGSYPAETTPPAAAPTTNPQAPQAKQPQHAQTGRK